METMLEMSRLEKGGGGGGQTMAEESKKDAIFRGEDSKCARKNLTKLMLIFVVCSMGSVLFSALKHPFSNNGSWTSPLYDFKLFKKDEPVQLPKFDKFLGGLLPQGLEESSCLSRYEVAALYHKKQTNHPPSSHLISRLRNYETLHKRCGPNTESYNRTLEELKSGQHNGTAMTQECNYVVWIPLSGLGNKMLSLASAFLYALLTNRTLLIHSGENIADLFCEPFLDVSWLLPSDFPLIGEFTTFGQRSSYTYGEMLRQRPNLTESSLPVPLYVYLYLLHQYDDHDKRFFCDQEQIFLQKVPWLVIKSNQYFIPSLFLIQSFEQELDDLFPEKEAVFHLLGRYLFHPTNTVWGLITRYHDAYLARADETTGIQIRTFENDPGPFKYVMDQILGCVRNENLLPEINDNDNDKNKNKTIIIHHPSNRTKAAVLITSLSSGYFEAFRDMYWEHETATGDVIGVYQPSHEEYQHTEDKMHNIKALAEIYLLSLSDKLITSSMSTFGYVAQSLGGLKPWMLTKSENQKVPDPPCQRAISMEPCFHYAPSQGCGSKRIVANADKIVPQIQQCEDRNAGLKLVNGDNHF